MLLGFAVLGETALRVAGFLYPSAAERDVIWNRERDRGLLEQRFYRRDAREIWKTVPSAEVPWASGEQLDSAGFRNEEVPLARTPGVVRIAILGSDEALGVGLPRERTWPFLLRQALEERNGKVEILCAAVEGTTLRQGLERWRAEVQPFHPDLVLCTYAGEMESRAANCGCSDSQRIADNCGQGFPDIRERPAPLTGPLRSSRFVQCCDWIADVLDGDYWTWRAGELDAQRLRMAEERFEAAGTRRVPVQEFSALASELHDELAREHVKLILVPITGENAVRAPSSAVRDYQALLLESAKQNKIARLSVLELFDEALLTGARVEDFYGAGLLSEGGHRFLAREIGKVLVHRLSELK
jgi:hypothetical protein